MNIIIGGAGDAGQYLGKILANEGNEVVFIDKDSFAVEKARDIDALAIEGDVCDYNSLLEAGINNCDFYLGMVKEDSDNLVSCSLANFYGCRTIARVKNPMLAKEPLSRRYTTIGTDIVLCPSLIVTSHISRIFAFPSRLKKLKKRKMSLYHAIADKNSFLVDKSISDLNLPKGTRIISVFRGINQFLPADSFVLQFEDDLCFVLDQTVKVKDVEKKIGCNLREYNVINNVFLAGVSDLGLSLARELLYSGISVSMMGLSENKVVEAASLLPKASVVKGDPLGQGVLKREGISKFDVLFALTNSIERNIFISILAKKFNVPLVISLIDRIDLKESIEGTLVDGAVVPNLLLANTILNVIRDKRKVPERTRKRRYMQVRSLQTKDILLAEIKVNKKMRCIRRKIGTFSPDVGNFLIPCIDKKGVGIIPDDNYMISEGDIIFILYHASDYESVKRWLIG